MRPRMELHRNSMNFTDLASRSSGFPQKLLSSRGHNFFATDPFGMSRHSRSISWLQFVDFCGFRPVRTTPGGTKYRLSWVIFRKNPVGPSAPPHPCVATRRHGGSGLARDNYPNELWGKMSHFPANLTGDTPNLVNFLCTPTEMRMWCDNDDLADKVRR